MENYLLSAAFWASVVILLCAFAVWLILNRISAKIKKGENTDGKRATNLRVIFAAVRFAVITFAVVSILQVNGVNVSSLIAGLGIAGIVVGFALQDILKDLIMGANIVWDNFFSVGDVVQYQNIFGVVTDFNIKVTKIHDLNTGNDFTVCNRNISEIEKVSDWLFVKTPMGYDVSVSDAREICMEICERVNELDVVKDCVFIGTAEFADSAIMYQFNIHCDPKFRCQTRRDALGIIQDIYEEKSISIPYPQSDVHFDKEFYIAK